MSSSRRDDMHDLHSLAADIETDRRLLAHALTELAQRVLDHVTDPGTRQAVRTALGLAMRLLSVRDGHLHTEPWAALVPIGGWRIVLGRSAPAVVVATDTLTDGQLYAIIGAVQRLERDDAISAGQAVRAALDLDVAVLLEHQLAAEVGMQAADLWATLGANVRDTARLVKLPEEV